MIKSTVLFYVECWTYFLELNTLFMFVQHKVYICTYFMLTQFFLLGLECLNSLVTVQKMNLVDWRALKVCCVGSEPG